MKIKGTRISYSLSLTPIVHTYPSTPPRAQAKIDKVLFTCTCDKEMPIIESEELACKKGIDRRITWYKSGKMPQCYTQKSSPNMALHLKVAVLQKVWMEGGCHFAASRCFCTAFVHVVTIHRGGIT